ncbi:JK_9P [Escherichia phage Jk06]|uniref:JK_9P n=1 Tax=Escherichia phage Jk06 TaxID=2886922 RepID=Q45Q06_9CAUD|nr:hypothetical protein JK_9 [Escherichia phage Jk06]AAZ29259.1 JK_9P [Escherichia phage Jk06]
MFSFSIASLSFLSCSAIPLPTPDAPGIFCKASIPRITKSFISLSPVPIISLICSIVAAITSVNRFRAPIVLSPIASHVSETNLRKSPQANSRGVSEPSICFVTDSFLAANISKAAVTAAVCPSVSFRLLTRVSCPSLRKLNCLSNSISPLTGSFAILSKSDIIDFRRP